MKNKKRRKVAEGGTIQQAGVGGIEAKAEIPTPLVQVQQNPPEPMNYDRFTHLFDELIREMDIVAGHQRKISAIRDELRELMKEK